MRKQTMPHKPIQSAIVVIRALDGESMCLRRVFNIYMVSITDAIFGPIFSRRGNIGMPSS
jgi:hypothetical protein